MVQQLRETVRPIFTVSSALSRGILKQRTGKSTIHFNGEFMNTELSFQIIHSGNPASIFAVVTNWCYGFFLKKEERTHSYTRGQSNYG